MNIGDLNTRVMLLEPKYGEERTGQQSITYTPRIPAWAKVDSFDQKDMQRFRQPGMTATSRLTIRQTSSVKAIKDDWRVLLEGQQYAIDSISHVDRTITYLNVRRVAP